MPRLTGAVLVYGDSLAWGSDPVTGARHPRGDRWPDVMSAILGDGVDVAVDAVRGRTTAYDEHTADADRNGARLLPTALYAHAPLDVVVLALGGNDFGHAEAPSAQPAVDGMRRLLEIVRGHAPRVAHPPPDVVIVAPPAFVPTDYAEWAAGVARQIPASLQVGALLGRLAHEWGCGFVDAARVAVADRADGVHLDLANTRAVGEAVAPVVAALLQRRAAS